MCHPSYPVFCLVLLDFKNYFIFFYILLLFKYSCLHFPNWGYLVECSELRLKCNTIRELVDEVSEEASELNRNPSEG